MKKNKFENIWHTIYFVLLSLLVMFGLIGLFIFFIELIVSIEELESLVSHTEHHLAEWNWLLITSLSLLGGAVIMYVLGKVHDYKIKKGKK